MQNVEDRGVFFKWPNTVFFFPENDKIGRKNTLDVDWKVYSNT